MNQLARAIGFRFFERSRRGSFELRLSWAEISGRLGLSFGLYNWSENEDWSLHIHLGWPNIYLKLPFLPRRTPRDEMLDCWAVSIHRDNIHINWGHRTKIINLPWQWTHFSSHQLMVDGSWCPTKQLEWKGDISKYRRIEDHDGVWKSMLPYRYKLRSGEIQERTATIATGRSEYRWRWLKWLPLPRKLYQSIDVRFSDEVGERTGSWKGGCIGCGYNARPNETPEETLRRMERDRKFD